ncbi:hypothetical protein JOC61_000838 [Marinitoga litoralis]|nr:hypothetical protein [Marinitoga litoralis]
MIISLLLDKNTKEDIISSLLSLTFICFVTSNPKEYRKLEISLAVMLYMLPSINSSPVLKIATLILSPQDHFEINTIILFDLTL